MNGTVGEVRIFAGSSAPRNWVFCEGQEFSVEDNPLLFSVLSNTYGGDGVTTFKVPDMRGRVPVGLVSAVDAPLLGLTDRPLGTEFGSETITLTENQLPPHSHPVDEALLLLGEGDGVSGVGEGNSLATAGVGDIVPNIYNSVAPTIPMDTGTLSVVVGDTGVGDPIEISQPSITMNYIICVVGSDPYNEFDEFYPCT